MLRTAAINRTQRVVLGFFAIAWLALVVILATSSEVREATLKRLPSSGATTTIGFAVALLAFLIVLAIGVVRRWRWLFWVMLLAFGAGLARIPVAVLQLSDRMAPEGPDWYVATQGVIGVVQTAIAVAMFVGYRRSGPWGSF